MMSGMADKPNRPSPSCRTADLGPRPPPGRRRLMLGPELMAELAYESYEAPWISVSVAAQPGLEPFLPYFADPAAWADDDPAVDAMLVEVGRRGGFKLFDEAGLEAEGFGPVNLTCTGGSLRY